MAEGQSLDLERKPGFKIFYELWSDYFTEYPDYVEPFFVDSPMVKRFVTAQGEVARLFYGPDLLAVTALHNAALMLALETHQELHAIKPEDLV